MLSEARMLLLGRLTRKKSRDWAALWNAWFLLLASWMFVILEQRSIQH